VQVLAKEWFTVAASVGHKPAMLELVEMSHSEGDKEGAQTWLRRITELPPVNEHEKWPKLVESAKRMLAGTTPPASRPPSTSVKHGTIDLEKSGPVGKGERSRKATVPGPARRKSA
jgi:hypothetical protein